MIATISSLRQSESSGPLSVRSISCGLRLANIRTAFQSQKCATCIHLRNLRKRVSYIVLRKFLFDARVLHHLTHRLQQLGQVLKRPDQVSIEAALSAHSKRPPREETGKYRVIGNTIKYSTWPHLFRPLLFNSNSVFYYLVDLLVMFASKQTNIPSSDFALKSVIIESESETNTTLEQRFFF